MFKISVIIATYNRCESLRDTLDSILAQKTDGSFDYEVIVADNNSNDKTKEIAGVYSDKFGGKLKYLFEPRQGKSNALNSALKEALGELIAFTDDDVIVGENWLKNIAQAFKASDAIAVTGKICPKWLTDVPEWLSLEGPYRFIGPLISFDLGEKNKEIAKEDNILPLGANLIIKREAFEKYGNFDIRYGRKGRCLIGGEDSELSLRLLKNDEKIMYFPDIVVYHKVDKNKINKSYFSKWSFWTGFSVYSIRPFAFNKNPRHLLLFLIKDFLRNFFILASQLISADKKRRFFSKMRFILSFGSILGYLNYKRANIF